jgi:phosphatidylserine decarboxylase
MASFQISPVSIAGLARSTLGRRSTTCRCRHIYPTYPTYPAGQQARAPPAHRLLGRRPFSQQSRRPGASSKVQDSRIRWYPIPVGLGVGFLGLVQFYKVYTREQEKQAEEDELEKRAKRRSRVRTDGPWYGH